MARPGLRQHPKFRRLCHLLRCPAPHALGYLEFIWSVAYEHGNPIIGDAVDVELAAEYPDKPGTLAKALAEVRFLDINADGKYAVHDLFDHAPEYVRRRMLREQERQVRGRTIPDIRRAAAQERWGTHNANGASDAPNDARQTMQTSGQLHGGDARHRASKDASGESDARTPRCDEGVDSRPMQRGSGQGGLFDANEPPQASREYANGATPAPAPAPSTHVGEVSPTTPRSKTTRILRVDEERMFAAFWVSYPRKVNKLNAQRKWAKIGVTKELLDIILTSLERQKQVWATKEPEFTPHPSTWLHGKRWEDEAETAKVAEPSLEELAQQRRTRKEAKGG